MQIIPSLDIEGGRSRIVWWPGASTGTGTPTDRPEVIAAALVERGVPLLHLVDLDGARAGRPANLEAIGAVARAVASPLQIAGGIDGVEQIEIAFAAGATRVLLPLWSVVEDPTRLADCLRVAGDWLGIGLDARPDRLRDYPWKHRSSAPTLEELVVELHAAGVGRFVFSHAGSGPDLGSVSRLAGRLDAEVLIAGGIDSVAGVARLKEAGITGVILGEALFNGSVDLDEALEIAA